MGRCWWAVRIFLAVFVLKCILLVKVCALLIYLKYFNLISMRNRFSKLGFTLIEILIVITIIGILAVVFLPSIMGAPLKAREAARAGDITNIAKAVDAGRLEGLSLTQTNGYQRFCMAPDLAGALGGLDQFLSYFPGGTVPVDPTDLADWDITDALDCNGQYLFVIFPKTQSAYTYGIFAQVEGSENALMRCAETAQPNMEMTPDEGGAALPATCGNTNPTRCCYGVRIQ